MKQVRLFVAALSLVWAASCNFTEEIYINENGSGKMSINFDGSELMAMAGDEMAQEEAVDSIMSFKDFLAEKKDSIAQLPLEEQEKLKKLEPFMLHIVMNPEEKKMKFDMYSDFKDITEMNDAFNTFQNAGTLDQSKSNGSLPAGGNSATKVEYSFKKRKFSRTATIMDKAKHQMALDSMSNAEMFLSSSTYTLKYHFPRKVKSANLEGATYSADGKTLIYEINFLDMMKDPTKLNVEVELERR